MLFIIDAQLPPDLAGVLTASGHQARHVSDIGMLAASDEEIWQFAGKTGSVIVTRDSDFAALSSLSKGPQVVWVRLGAVRNTRFTERLAPVWPLVVQALEKGDRLVEVV